MADELDRAAVYEEIERRALIAGARRPVPGLPYTGACHFCAEPVPAPQRFCDGDCAADHERERAAMRRRGRATY